MAFGDRVRQVWNAFTKVETTPEPEYGSGNVAYGSASSPSQPRFRFSTTDRTIITSVYTRIAIDVAAAYLRHIGLDSEGRYLEDKDSNLNSCLTLEPNLDQGPRAFRQDIVMSLFDWGCAALVPVDTTLDPATQEMLDIVTLRVGQVKAWYPQHVKICVYNEATGKRQDITLEKRYVALIENPLYAVMNSPNSTLQLLIRTLNQLDAVGEQSASGKLDIIIQLPYTIKSESKRLAAEQRRDDIEMQLRGSQYGIAYADGTEKITQLNRPAENNLLAQVEYLVNMLYGQLGITEGVMNGTADEKTMINYYNRTIEPILDAIVEAMQRAFIGHTGTANNEKIDYFNNPFRFVPVASLADIADKFTRNEIFAANEIRGFMGAKPHKNPKADELNNSNMPPYDQLQLQQPNYSPVAGS